MEYVEKDVFVFHEVDVAFIGKQPIGGPGIEKYERVSRINKLSLIRNDCSRRDNSVDGEGMLFAKICLELRIRNVSAFFSWSGFALLGTVPCCS